MGQKVHPYGFRLGYIKSWHSSWYAKDRYAELLHEDIKMRAYIEKTMKAAAVASIDISRTSCRHETKHYFCRTEQIYSISQKNHHQKRCGYITV